MFKSELLKNKIFAIAILIFGALTVLVTADASFFIMTIILSMCLFFSKKNWIY